MKSGSEDSGFEDQSQNQILLQANTPEPPKISSVTPGLPPCRPLAASGYSLEADMLFGQLISRWRPRTIMKQAPVPLTFALDPIPSKKPIFYGFRPEDSFELHQTYSELGRYKMKVPQTAGYRAQGKKRAFLGMDPSIDFGLKFSSTFESGNLDKVVKVNELQFDLYVRTDSNTKGHNQWFFFCVKEIEYQREVKFNIVNLSKRDSLFTQGLQPSVFSSIEGKWKRGGTEVKYTYSKINKNLQKNVFYYQLSFQYNLVQGDTIYFAYSIPYTYSDLLDFLDTLQSPYLKKEVLCKTLTGVQVPLLTVTDEKHPRKQTVFLTSRVHPGQTNCSFVMQGLIQSLLAQSEEADFLRKRFLFKIVPMLNPDGVIAGNNRCNLAGDDLNRQFQDPDQRLHPTVFHIKKLLSASNNIFAYFDFHAHSKKKSSFLYGPYYPLHQDNYYKIRVLPKLMSEITQKFRYYSSKFRFDWSKRHTARLVVSKEYRVPFSYTLETSYHGYLDTQRNTFVFTLQKLRQVGWALAEAISTYRILRDQELKLQESNKMKRLGKKKKSESRVRTMAQIIQSIKEQHQESDSDSDVYDSSDSQNENQHQKMRNSIIEVLEKSPFMKRSDHKIERAVLQKNQTRLKTSQARHPFPRTARPIRTVTRAESMNRRQHKEVEWVSRPPSRWEIYSGQPDKINIRGLKPVVQAQQLFNLVKSNNGTPISAKADLQKINDSKSQRNLLNRLKLIKRTSASPQKKVHFAVKGKSLKATDPQRKISLPMN